MTDLGRSKNEDVGMTASCRTVKAYGTAQYLRYEKVGRIKGKQDSQK